MGAGHSERRLCGGRDSARGQPGRRNDVQQRDAPWPGELPACMARRGRAGGGRDRGARGRLCSCRRRRCSCRSTADHGCRARPRYRGSADASGCRIRKRPAIVTRSPFDVFATADAVNSATDEPGLFRGDYSQFASTQASVWTSLPLPDLGQQYSGDVFVEVTRPGNGDVLLLQPQPCPGVRHLGQPGARVPLAHARQRPNHHVDLHGIYLSHDFQARFDFGYRHVAGTMWMTSDGGVHTSENGGESFDRGRDVNTLSCVNIAGVAKQGTGRCSP